MNNTEIGISTIGYDEQGDANYALFTPLMGLSEEGDDLHKFVDIKSDNDETKMKAQAESIFATWFEKFNQIELADRQKYVIGSDIVSCEKYPNGNVKKIQFKFIFKELQSPGVTIGETVNEDMNGPIV